MTLTEHKVGAFRILVNISKFQATFSTSNLTIKSKGGILAKAYEHILELHQKCGLSEQHYNKEDVEELLQERNQLKNEVSTNAAPADWCNFHQERSVSPLTPIKTNRL